MSVTTSFFLRQWLAKLQAEDPNARTELIGYVRRRMRLLAKRMFAHFSLLHAFEETDDVLQEAMFRLWRALEETRPTTIVDLMGLAALQLRRSLRDLARKHYGRNAGLEPRALKERFRHFRLRTNTAIEDPKNAPAILISWSEFHEAVDQLPEPDRTVVDLLFYHGLQRSEASEVMGISERQVGRRWHDARRKLMQLMEGSWPEL